MILKASFQGSSEIGAYTTLTNTYCLIGHTPASRTFASAFSCLKIPVIECTISNATTIGSLTQGNKNGLLVPNTITSAELQHLKNSLDIPISVLDEKLNALGNNILTNDRVALVHPCLTAESLKVIENTLKVDCIRHSIGSESLVGTYGAMNNVGLLACAISNEEAIELAELLDVQVLCGTVNAGLKQVGGGLVVNDFVCFAGLRTTTHEVCAMESVFKIGNSNEEARTKAVIENLS